MPSSMGAWHARPDQAELLPDALLVICAVPVVAGTPGSTHMHSMVVGIICSLPATPCGQYFGGPKGVIKHRHTHSNIEIIKPATIRQHQHMHATAAPSCPPVLCKVSCNRTPHDGTSPPYRVWMVPILCYCWSMRDSLSNDLGPNI